MSRALHVAKTYKVEWESTEAFNRQSYEFRRLLNELGVGVSSMSAEDDDYLDFEVTKEDWQHAINTLSRPTLTQGVKAMLTILGYTQEQAVEIFKRCLDTAEPEEEWMHFSFF